ncbi:hypothetical protein O181_060501 [Austropuccinia psidii MF-1]|uniref:Uncharacterized protein n=1 Tax=Austropuccinia psidii MF-1 TaxID=1389203 RepID=A0A9Q3EE99_9BASI|nr:hypothetical protein [Austropuccinia psidii MF-1]
MGQEILKEVPKLKEWPNLSGEGEYDYMEFIRGIDMLKEDFESPERLVKEIFNTLFTRSAHRWYIKLRQAHGVTTTSLTFLLDGCGNPTWSQVGSNWSCHIFYGQLAPLGVPWRPCHNTFQWPYPAVIGLFGQFPLHQPPGLHL